MLTKVLLICALWLGFGQAGRLEELPASSDQVAVYAAFLTVKTGSEKSLVNVARTTTIFANEPADGAPGDFTAKLPMTTLRELHRLPESLEQPARVHLVEAAEYRHQRSAPPEPGLANLLTLSEVLFDATHTRAAFRYGYSCPGLCGNGATICLLKKDGQWVIVGYQRQMIV